MEQIQKILEDELQELIASHPINPLIGLPGTFYMFIQAPAEQQK
jgi:hypothetical protein